MTYEEAAIFIEGKSEASKQDWEKVRFLMWATFQCQSTKNLDPSEILKFPWEEESDDEDHEVTQEEINTAFAQAKAIQKMISK